MSKVLIIGAGAAGSVVVKKCFQQQHIFSKIYLASRTLSKCDRLNQACNNQLEIYQCNADNVSEVVSLIQKTTPDLVINMALPYQDLPIMAACLQTSTNYMDTANYEPKDDPTFSYSWQWAYNDAFKEKQCMALLGSGFDPGVTNVFISYLAKHYFDSFHSVDIVDCNAGSHGHPFATNFNPEINIREITQDGRYVRDGQWHTIPALSKSNDIDFPEVGRRRAYLLYHEELESLVRHFPSIQNIRFWMTFSEEYLTHLSVLQSVGMTSIQSISHKGHDIVPLEFLKDVLPDPGSLSANYSGKTCIGCIVSGEKNGKPITKFIYNCCDHAQCHQEVQAQAVSYTTGVPAMIGAKMILTNQWTGNGVFNMEQFDPDPFMSELSVSGLPWTIIDASPLAEQF